MVTYQAKWGQRRRALFFEGKKCIDCGSTSRLRLSNLKATLKKLGVSSSTGIFHLSKEKFKKVSPGLEVRCIKCFFINTGLTKYTAEEKKEKQREWNKKNKERFKRLYPEKWREKMKRQIERAKLKKEVRKMSKEELQKLAQRLAKERGII